VTEVSQQLDRGCGIICRSNFDNSSERSEWVLKCVCLIVTTTVLSTLWLFSDNCNGCIRYKPIYFLVTSFHVLVYCCRIIWSAGVLAAMGNITYPSISSFVSAHASDDQQGTAVDFLLLTLLHISFPATAASFWNSLPESARSSPSLQVFHSRLKTKLFAWSYSHD